MVSTMLPGLFLWCLLQCKGRLSQPFIAAGTGAISSDGISVIPRSRKDFQGLSRDSSAPPPPARRRESLRLPTRRFSAEMFSLSHDSRAEAAMGCEFSLCPSRFGSREGRQVAGAVPLRCCSGEKTIPTEIPAFLLTFCSKKIHCDTFQSSKTGGDKSLGSSVRFGSNKNLTKDPLVLPSTKRRVIYHERDQKWMQSYSLLPSLLTCSPLEHQEESSQEHVKDPHGHSWDGNSLPALSREHKVEQHRTEESLLTRRWGAA